MADNGKINWDNFNFLENLLIHCVLDSREVPAESGVKFRISKDNKEGELCLVFNIDRKNDPLIKDQSVRRPDYLVFYFNEKKENPCIFTIVEMKGKAHKNLKGGLEQIKNLKNRLQKEISEHLPTKFNFKIQGILLSPHNSDIPRKEIEKEATNGFKILSIQYTNRA
jgi:hypothetical protein